MLTIVYGLLATVLFLVVRVVYRVFFHPLSHFPGPKLAAASSAYVFYYNVIKQGCFIWELERMHNVYGPIVRISPTELHVRDSDYYDEIYASGTRKSEKDPTFAKMFGVDGSMFATVGHEVHRERRTLLHKFFSKSSITNVEYIIQESLDQLCKHLKSSFHAHKVVNLDAGFAGLTSDVVHQYTIGYHSGNLDTEDFNHHVRDGINGLFRAIHLNFFFPILHKVLDAVPMSVLKKLNPFMYALVQQKLMIDEQVADIISGKIVRKGSVMQTLVDNGIPQHLSGDKRLSTEMFSLLTAGTETTARALAVGFFYIINEKNIKNKLQEELKTVMPTPDSRPTWDQLKQLPYLTGVVSEAIRLAIGTAARSPRVAPNDALIYGDYVIPPGTSVGQSHYFVLTDPAIFIDPHSFDPERWTRAAAKGERLDRYLVNFSKGPRNCIGLNLAYAEMYLTIGRVVRQFNFELHDTTEKDIAFARDFSIPYPDQGSSKLAALVEDLVEE